MRDFLSELCDQFDQEEQARIKAAEASTTAILAQGTAAADGRRRVAESLHDSYWVFQPLNDARIDSAGVVFVAYVNALWRKTDAARAECIHDFLAKVEELIEPILTMYGCEGKDPIAELRAECAINAWHVHSMLPPSPANATFSTEDSGASSLQDGADHGQLGHSEATDATEQSETEKGQSGDAERPVIPVQPPTILEFSDSWRKRMRRIEDLNARYARRLSTNGLEFEKQEDLLKDARVWAADTLGETVSEVEGVRKLRERVVKQTWDQFVPRHRYHSDLRLGYREFGSALWEEGWPSVEERAIEAIQERAALAATGTSNEAESGASVQAPNGVKEEQEVPRAATVTVVLESNHPVTVVRAAGTAAEFRWDTRAGGDFKNYLLFHTLDRVKTGDEVHCELFDSPRTILRVDPDLMQGGMRNRRATIIPRSLGSRGRQANPSPVSGALRNEADAPELRSEQESRRTEPESEVASSDTAASAEAKGTKKRGRRSNPERREDIKQAILKHGEVWRDHLSEIFEEMDREGVELGDFQNLAIDLGDGQSKRVSSWDDLGLADGDQRRKLIDALRKYLD